MAKIDEAERMSDRTADGQEAQHDAESRVTRRRALIAGLAAAPVVLSLMNRSAWAQVQYSCATVTSWVSNGGAWSSPSISKAAPTTADLNSACNGPQ